MPIYKEKFVNRKEKQEYNKKRKIFEAYLNKAHEGNKDKPYILPLLESFKYHAQILEKEEKKDSFKRKFKGIINFESLSGADIKPIKYFHKYKDKVSIDYTHRVVSINFPTKNSLDGGIEIADLISYVSCQTLRFSHKLYAEIAKISENRKKLLKRMRDVMRNEFKIDLVDVTNYSLPKSKKS